MTGLIVVLAVLAALALLLLLPVIVRVEYSEKNLVLRVRVWFVTVFALPKKEKEKPAEEKEQKPEKPAKKPAKKPKHPGDMRKLVLAALKKAVKLPGKMNVRKLRVRTLIPGADDPFKAAMLYGAGWSGRYMAEPLLKSVFGRVNNIEYESEADFTATEPLFEAEGTLSVKVLNLVVLAFGILAQLIRNAVRRSM